jgi:hypothetical protein
MSIDERLRAGLALNTEHLGADLERELATTYRHAHRRRLVRRGVIAAVAAAAVAASAWLVDLPSPDSDVAPVVPTPTPTDLRGMQGPLEAGLYSVPVWGTDGETSNRAIFDVPEGYFANGGWVIDAGFSGTTDDQYGAITVWRVLQVLTDPCHRRTAVDIGPTVQDLARALVTQTGPSTQPEPVVLDGHSGLTLDVTIPPDIDLSRCTRHGYSLWRFERRGDGALTEDTPGLVNRLWILDVDGTRLVVVASLYPDEPVALHQELVTIAESVHFGPSGS